jgi:nitrite reductase/ring-hydroxylating ferredoxin subunit
LGNRFPFGLPAGWYVVATSDEVKPGEIVSRSYFEREIVIFRTRSGALSVIDAHCPHMGAHLGKMGRIEGEILRCGFHGFRFGADGACVATAYDGPPPAKARLTRWQVREQNGLILVWFDPLDRPPDWEVPPLDQEGWSPALWKRYRINSHPQETTENSVDFGHFTQLHGFVDGEMVGPLETDGPILTSSYAAYRCYGVPGIRSIKIRVEYDVKVMGLGYSQVDIRLPALRWSLRAWVLPVPVDDEHIDLLLGLAGNKNMGPMMRLARRVGHRIVCKEVEQDLDVWQYKIFRESPALAKGDGPIGAYRSWAKQFYPETS